MKRLKFRGFTLIELLIVVAIIAILAAIAVPNFLEAQVRSKVSRSKTDMRTMATALEAYFVDNNTYAGSATDVTGTGLTVNSMLQPPAVGLGGAAGRLTHTTYRPVAADGMGLVLTTPIAYIGSYPRDPFADTKGSTFGYFNAADIGWIEWSYGPDIDETPDNGQIQSKLVTLPWAPVVFDGPPVMTFESIYNPYQSNPSLELMCGVINLNAYTYDPTNGTNSLGDIWRVKE